jgi:hypothetical protein
MKQRGIATDGGNACRTKVGERAKGGYHPRGDRKSAEVIENRGDSGLSLRKRVRNRMIILGLQGCDRRERAYVVY